MICQSKFCQLECEDLTRDSFKLEGKPLGKGGYAKVYEAHSKKDFNKYALKIINKKNLKIY